MSAAQSQVIVVDIKPQYHGNWVTMAEDNKKKKKLDPAQTETRIMGSVRKNPNVL